MARNSGKSGDSTKLWRISGMGLELVGAIIGMAALGWFIDRGLSSSPKATIACLIIGIIGGGYNFIREALKISRAESAAYKAAHRDRPRSTGDNPRHADGDWFERTGFEEEDRDARSKHEQ